MGVVILVVASALALAAAAAGVIFTAPSQSQCPNPNGGQDIPCPPGPLTTNNLFTLLALVILSAVFFALGIVIEMMVWFRAHPTD